VPGGCSLLVENNLSVKPAENAASSGGAAGHGGSGGASSSGGAAGHGGSGGATSSSGTIGCDGQCAAAACCGGVCVDLMINEDHCGACDNPCLSGRTCVNGACDPSWVSISPVGAPAPRTHAAAAWIGDGMFVWGGRGEAGDLDDGAIYDPASDAWKPLGVGGDGAPSPRVMASAVWTGSAVVVIGGGPWASGVGYADGGRYDPATKMWSPVSPLSPPTGRRLPIAVWTGTRVLVWGGEENGTPIAGGGLYNPSNDTWTSLPTTGAPTARSGAAWVWTGTKLLLFGGRINGIDTTSEGYVYDLAGLKWSPMSSDNAPDARYDAFAVWMGDPGGPGEMLVWGGRDGNDEFDDGARYDPVANKWLKVSGMGAPSKRAAPSGRSGVAGWTGLQAILVAGVDGNWVQTDGAHYDRGDDDWPMNVPSWPSGNAYDRGVGLFTGHEIILWSGFENGGFITGGERYKP
jgi:hypothetical protein